MKKTKTEVYYCEYCGKFYFSSQEATECESACKRANKKAEEDNKWYEEHKPEYTLSIDTLEAGTKEDFIYELRTLIGYISSDQYKDFSFGLKHTQGSFSLEDEVNTNDQKEAEDKDYYTVVRCFRKPGCCCTENETYGLFASKAKAVTAANHLIREFEYSNTHSEFYVRKIRKYKTN